MCNRDAASGVHRELEVYVAALILVDAGLTNLKHHPAVVGRLDPEDSIPVLRMADAQDSVRYALRRLQTVRALLPQGRTGLAPALATSDTR